MSLYITVFLACFIAALVLFGLNMFLESQKFKETGTERYNFLKFFPYELNMFHRLNKVSFIHLILPVLGSLCLLGSMVFFGLGVIKQGGAVTAAFILVGAHALFLIAFNLLRFIKLTNYRNHLIFSSITVGSLLLIAILSAFFFFNGEISFFRNNHLAIRIIASGISILIIVFEFILLFNKSYKDWAKLVKVEAENFSRPKHCYLAIVEWGSALAYLITYIPLILMMIL